MSVSATNVWSGYWSDVQAETNQRNILPHSNLELPKDTVCRR